MGWKEERDGKARGGMAGRTKAWSSCTTLNLFHIILHKGLDHFRTTIKLSMWQVGFLPVGACWETGK